MEKRYIDLSDIKNDETEKTASFVDLMSRAEKLERKKEKEEENRKRKKDDIFEEDTSFFDKNEKRKLKKKRKKQELTFEEEYDNSTKKSEDLLEKTGVLELTRQMRFNMQENIKEEKKKGYNYITDIGICILIALGYFIYALLFTDYLDNELFLLIDGSIILFMFILFGITMLTSKKNNKALAVINLLILLGYITFNILNIIQII